MPVASLLPARVAAAVALGALAATMPGAGPAGAPAAAAGAGAPAMVARADGDPLTVQIESVTPAVIPAKGRIRLTGTVTNDSDEQWRVIKMYPLTSSTPFTTPEQLAEAAATDPAQPFGDRITTEGVYDTIDVLDPGKTARFTVRVSRGQLQISGEPGVYWIGVHALGETDAGREEVPVADGRDRVFVPLRDPPTGKRTASQPSLDTALVVPLRHQVRYAADGKVADPDQWAADLEPTGSLGRLLEIADEAGTRPLTWVVDPAVTDAVSRLGRDNPPRSLDDTITPPGGSGAPTDQPSDGASPTEDGTTAGGGSDAASRPATSPPHVWLNRMRADLGGGDQLLTLPYGDTDIAGTADHAPDLYEQARDRAGRRIVGLDLPAAPVVAPPGGFLDEAGFDMVQENTTVLASDLILDRATRARGPAVVTTLAHRVYLTNSAVDQGSGSRQDSVLDVRQRLLAESLVRLLAKRGPLIVTLPTDESTGWDPAAVRDLFEATDAASWVHLTTIGALAGRHARSVPGDRLRYPQRIEGQELGTTALATAEGLMARGRLLDSVLPFNDTVADQVDAEALTLIGYDDRSDQVGARGAAASARGWIDARLAEITVEAPPSVTLSSDSGRLSADVVNGLDHTVLVRVQAATDPGLQITPTEVQELGPGERATLQLEATATTLAVHSVSLIVANEDGVPVGTATTFPLRANRVSQVIWVVIGVGALLLFTTIGVRLVRRVRRGLGDRRERRRMPGAAA